MAEKRITIDQIKIRGKQTELRNLISYIEYLGVAKTVIKYGGYFVEFESSLICSSH